MSLKTKLTILAAAAVVTGLVLVIGWRPRRRDGLRAAFDAEFLTRPDGYDGLRRAYGLRFPAPPRQMDPGLMYNALAQGAVDVIDGFATDGRIAAYDLVTLTDDRRFFPPYYAAPLVRAETLAAHPELGPALDALAGGIDDDAMSAMNYEVDEVGRSPREVAEEFLAQRDLLDSPAADTRTGEVVIGGKQFTEQEILGEILAALIERHTSLRVVRRLNLGGTMICFNALKAGDLDLYPEYTGTGLVNILKEKTAADPDAAYSQVKSAFRDRFGLVWLQPFGFNNTYTLTMRRTHARALGIETISDLAAHLAGKDGNHERLPENDPEGASARGRPAGGQAGPGRRDGGTG